MKVNIILITYNQEQYIRQTLDSILLQKADCDIEIIVADDASLDNTLSIIEEYAEKVSSPFTFNFLPKEKNLGYVRNYQRTFKACTGKYIAIMEGDDYWTETNHIESHITFLESHADCSMSYNRHIRNWVDENREEIYDWNIDGIFEEITGERLALGNCIGNLSCCMFRTKYVELLDPPIFDLEVDDWLLGMVMGQYGFIAYLKEVTSAYRIHAGGQWSRMTEKEQAEKIMSQIDIFDEFLCYRYTEEFTLHKKRIMIGLYGDKSLRGRIKNMTPASIRKIYRKIISKR